MKQSNKNKRTALLWLMIRQGLFLILIVLAWTVWLLIKYHLKLI